jgi:hypothetical protein
MQKRKTDSPSTPARQNKGYFQQAENIIAKSLSIVSGLTAEKMSYRKALHVRNTR